MANKTTATKPWYDSKIIWVGIVTTIVGIFGFLELQYPGVSIFTTLSGVATIILRALTTATPISSGK